MILEQWSPARGTPGIDIHEQSPGDTRDGGVEGLACVKPGVEIFDYDRGVVGKRVLVRVRVPHFTCRGGVTEDGTEVCGKVVEKAGVNDEGGGRGADDQTYCCAVKRAWLEQIC